MLQIMRFKALIDETRSIVSLETHNGHRVDVSKKFIRRLNSDQVYFVKDGNEILIVYDNLYIVECTYNAHALDPIGNPILMIRDILPYSYVMMYKQALDTLEDSPLKPW